MAPVTYSITFEYERQADVRVGLFNQKIKNLRGHLQMTQLTHGSLTKRNELSGLLMVIR